MKTSHRAYWDTCIPSGLARRDLDPEEQAAANSLVELVQRSGLTVCTSTEALGEIRAIPKEHREPHLRQYDQIAILTRSAVLFDSTEVFRPEAKTIVEH